MVEPTAVATLVNVTKEEVTVQGEGEQLPTFP